MNRLIVFLVVASASSLNAQSRLGVDRAAVSGVVLDSSSGKPPRKSQICPIMKTGPTWVAGPCSRPDSLRRYRLDDLLLTTVDVTVSCATARGFGNQLAREILIVTEPKEIEKDWIVSGAGCDPRPTRRVTGVYRGFWTPGFEASEFIPCPSNSWSLPGDSLPREYNAQRAWAVLGKNAQIGKVPDAPRDAWGNPKFYVAWRGTLEGPGQYGHFGMSTFSFVADTVIELRAPRRGDCGLPSH